MLCNEIIENKYCKNYVYRMNKCFCHYKKEVHFNLEKNEVYYVNRYIHHLKKYPNGRWIYQNSKPGGKLSKVEYY